MEVMPARQCFVHEGVITSDHLRSNVEMACTMFDDNVLICILAHRVMKRTLYLLRVPAV